MNNYKKMFKELIEGLSDYTFFELKGWLAHNFADVTDGFDEDFDEEYLDKLREYINYLEEAYKIKESIVNATAKELPDIFYFDRIETQELILDSVDGMLEQLNNLFIEQDIMTMEITYKEVDDISKRDMEMLSEFIDNVTNIN